MYCLKAKSKYENTYHIIIDYTTYCNGEKQLNLNFIDNINSFNVS